MQDQDSFSNPEPPSSLTQNDFRKILYQQVSSTKSHASTTIAKSSQVKQKTFEEIQARVASLVSSEHEQQPQSSPTKLLVLSKPGIILAQKIMNILDNQAQTEINAIDLFIPGKSVFSFPDNIEDPIILKTKKLSDYGTEARQYIMTRFFIEKLSRIMDSIRTGTHSSQQKREYLEQDIYSNIEEYIFESNPSSKNISSQLFKPTTDKVDEPVKHKRQITIDYDEYDHIEEDDLEEVKKTKTKKQLKTEFTNQLEKVQKILKDKYHHK